MLGDRRSTIRSTVPFHPRRGILILLGIAVLSTPASIHLALGEDKAADPRASFRAWGAETLAQIDKDLRVGNLYTESGTAAGKKSTEHGSAAFVWPASFQLRALASAAKLEPRKYAEPLARYAAALDRYWTARRGVGGYAVVPGSQERYYDDNAWMLLGLIDAFEVTKSSKLLERARQVLAFLESGEKKTVGGGIRQHEDKDGGIFTCTAAPAAVGALRLYLIRKDPKLLEFAKRMHAALTSKEIGLRDGDGLYHQWARKEGAEWHVERGKRAYQSALPLQLELLLHRVTGEAAHLSEAQRIAESALGQWFRKDGTLAETGQWGGSDLCDALLDLHAVDADPRWREAVDRALLVLHERGRDSAGRYGEDWGVDYSKTPLAEVKLLYIAPVARAYWRAAAPDVKEKKGAGKTGKR